jgi:hypothetical protein
MTDPNRFTSSVADVTPPASTTPEAKPAQRPPRAFWAPVGDLLGVEPPPMVYVLRLDDKQSPQTAFLPAGKVGMVASPGGVGKSTLLAYIAVAVATGRPLLGVAPMSAGRVLLCFAEEDLDEAVRRLRRAVAAAVEGLDVAQRRHVEGRAARNLYLHTAGGSVRLADMVRVREQRPAKAGETAERIIERVEAEHTGLFLDLVARLNDESPEGQNWDPGASSTPWRLVVLDPLSRWWGLDNENDNAAATRAVEVFEELARTKHGPAVLVAHHEAKTQNEGAGAIRGASALVDGMRWASRLQRLPTGPDGPRYLVWQVVKSNYTRNGLAVFVEQVDTGEQHRWVPATAADVFAAVETEKARQDAESAKRRKAQSAKAAQSANDKPTATPELDDDDY